MKTISKAASAAALLLVSATLWAQTTIDEPAVTFECTNDAGDSSTYEIYLYTNQAPPKPWEDAQDFATGSEFLGVTGHLATFSDAAEEECVLLEASALGLEPNQQLWIGLEQVNTHVEPGDRIADWKWSGEPDNNYRNWAMGEPNNSGNEDHATIGRFGYTLDGGYNDEDPDRGSLFGFVVEYDVVDSVEVVVECADGDCTIPIPSANPSNNKIVLPIETDGTASVDVFEISETCPLSSEGVRMVSFDSPLSPIPVPNYLCAENWILISSELSEDIIIDSGVVEAQFDPDDFGLTGFDCASNQVPAGIPLPQPVNTDIVTYLPASKNWDTLDGAPRLDPYMQETTYACTNPSLARMAGNQYFGVGLNFNYPAAMTAEAEVEELVRLTRRKLERLKEAILEAKLRGVIGPFRGIRLLILVELAIADVDHYRFDKASLRINHRLPRILNRTRFRTDRAGGANYEGEIEARSSNIGFLLDVYVGPYFGQP